MRGTAREFLRARVTRTSRLALEFSRNFLILVSRATMLLTPRSEPWGRSVLPVLPIAIRTRRNPHAALRKPRGGTANFLISYQLSSITLIFRGKNSLAPSDSDPLHTRWKLFGEIFRFIAASPFDYFFSNPNSSLVPLFSPLSKIRTALRGTLFTNIFFRLIFKIQTGIVGLSPSREL